MHEKVLAQHPGVGEVAVIGVAHPRWGETPKAFVVPELIAFTRTHLAHYKCPPQAPWDAPLALSDEGPL